MTEALRHADIILASSAIVVASGTGFYTYRQAGILNDKLDTLVKVVSDHDKLLNKLAGELDSYAKMLGESKSGADETKNHVRFVTNELKRWSSDLDTALSTKDVKVPALTLDPPRRRSRRARHQSSSSEDEEEEIVRESVKRTRQNAPRTSFFK